MTGNWMIFYELFLHNYYKSRSCREGGVDVMHKMSANNALKTCIC
jgi:hypothetical protein